MTKKLKSLEKIVAGCVFLEERQFVVIIGKTFFIKKSN